AKTKLPDSSVAGRATVFVFPDLNTGNNTYKAVQRSAGAIAIGPVLQGLNKPVNDLSRGALVDDIINTVVITAIQAQAEPAAAPLLADPTAWRDPVIHAGASSLPCPLLAPGDGSVDATGIVERVGQEAGTAKIAAGERTSTFEGPVADHKEAMQIVESLFEDVGLSLDDDRIRAVGHRVVQGGARYSAPVLIDDQVRWDIKELGKLAPLHNYASDNCIDGT